jgi:hypothetical protein
MCQAGSSPLGRVGAHVHNPGSGTRGRAPPHLDIGDGVDPARRDAHHTHVALLYEDDAWKRVVTAKAPKGGLAGHHLRQRPRVRQFEVNVPLQAHPGVSVGRKRVHMQQALPVPGEAISMPAHTMVWPRHRAHACITGAHASSVHAGPACGNARQSAP